MEMRNLIYLSIYGSTSLCWSLDAFFSFLIFYTIGRTPWMGDQLVARPIPAHTGQHKHTDTSTPRVGFEHTIPMFVRVETFHALDRTATVIDWENCRPQKF
jgi:hypothetical protein